MKQYDEKIEQLIKQAKDNRLSNPKLVLEAARKLRDIAKADSDKALLGFADYAMANAHFTLNDAESVSHYAGRALPNLLAENEWNLAGSTYNVLALINFRTGSITEGMEYLAQAMKLVEEHQLNLLGTVVYMNAADISVQLEDPSEALHNLLIAETYLDNCPEDAHQPYYYLIASSEAAAYALQVNRLELYHQQKEILDGILEKHPEYQNEVNVLLLEYQEAHEQKKTEKEEALVEEIKTALFSTSEFLDYTNELLNFLHILLSIKKYDILDEVLEYLTQSLNGHESAGIMNLVSFFKVQYYLATDQEDLLNAELLEYWRHSRTMRHQTNEAILSLIKTQHNLEVSERTNERLRELADTDSLTSLPNRRSLNEKLDQIFELAYHKEHYLGVEMLDVDNFKSVNDTYGHSTGDDVLVLLGRCLREISNVNIYAARYGGDEFVIVFDNLNDEDITKVNQKLVELLRHGIESASLPAFTISQGVFAKVPKNESKPWDYTSTADAALYVSKNAGRNHFLLVHSPKELKEGTANYFLHPNHPQDPAK